MVIWDSEITHPLTQRAPKFIFTRLENWLNDGYNQNGQACRLVRYSKSNKPTLESSTERGANHPKAICLFLSSI